MILSFNGVKVLFKEIDLKSLMTIENGGRIYEILPFLILEWSIDKKISFKNVLNLSPEAAERIYKESRKEYDLLENIEENMLSGWIASTIKKSGNQKISFRGFEDKEIKVIKECLKIKNTLFDHRGNMISYPERGGYLEQNAKYMYFLRIYQEQLKIHYNNLSKRKK